MLYVNIRKKLNDFTLDIQFETNNETLALLGPSGSGKSMTLKCIAGIEKPDEGEIILNDRILFSSRKKINLPPQKRKIGLLFQNYALFPNMTLEENIKIAVSKKHKDKDRIVKEFINRFSLEGLENSYPYELSGGQQQRAALARMLVNEPELIMLDEPFSALDDHLKWQMEQELINLLNEQKMNSIFVSHNRDEAYRISDKIAVLESGKILSLGTKDELFNNPKSVNVAKILGCSNISRIEKIDEKEVYAIDWDMKLICKRFVDENVKYIGIFENNIEIHEDINSKNTFELKIVKIIENAFSYVLTLKNPNGKSNIYLKVNKNDFNRYNLAFKEFLNVKLREENLLLLY